MKPVYENGLVVGNTYAKYSTRNPVARYLVRRFLSRFDALVQRVQPRTVLEVGCGDGELSRRVAAGGADVLGTDVSALMVEIARTRARVEGSTAAFEQASIYDVRPGSRYDLVICCEVLEHVSAPDDALAHLCTLADPYLLVSVPREPLWRLLNIARCRYLRDAGNTPGHVQHWSRASFIRLLGRHVRVIEENSPLPWTMVLCQRNGVDEG